CPALGGDVTRCDIGSPACWAPVPLRPEIGKTRLPWHHDRPSRTVRLCYGGARPAKMRSSKQPDRGPHRGASRRSPARVADWPASMTLAGMEPGRVEPAPEPPRPSPSGCRSGRSEMQEPLDHYLLSYNRERPHQGRGMNGRNPLQAFTEGLPARQPTEEQS